MSRPVVDVHEHLIPHELENNIEISKKPKSRGSDCPARGDCVVANYSIHQTYAQVFSSTVSGENAALGDMKGRKKTSKRKKSTCEIR